MNATITHLQKSIEKMPRLDAFTDGLRENVARALDDAGKAYAVFLETRDCEGET